MVKKSMGKPVKGSNFFNRKRELRRLWRCLESDNVLLLAPRRVGKTSLRIEDSRHLFRSPLLKEFWLRRVAS